MNWGLGQGAEMKMNYEAKSLSFLFSVHSSVLFLLSSCSLYFEISSMHCIG